MNAPNTNTNAKERRPVVWIAHDKGGYDFSKASMHGELRRVFRGEFNPFDLTAARRHAEEILKDSQPEDWIIGVGNGLAQVIVALVFSRLHDRLPVLVYHTQRFEYVKRELTALNQEIAK